MSDLLTPTTRPLSPEERAELRRLLAPPPRGPLWWIGSTIAVPLALVIAVWLGISLVRGPQPPGPMLLTCGVAVALALALQAADGGAVHRLWFRATERLIDGGGLATFGARVHADLRDGLAERLEVTAHRVWWVDDIDDDLPALLVDVGDGLGLFLYGGWLEPHTEQLFDDDDPRILGATLLLERAPESGVVLAFDVGGAPIALEPKPLRARDLPGYDGESSLAIELQDIPELADAR